MTKYTDDSSNFGADGPFFRIIQDGLQGLVDGEDYFDLLADDVVFEFVITVPGNQGKELATGTLNAILKKAGLK